MPTQIGRVVTPLRLARRTQTLTHAGGAPPAHMPTISQFYGIIIQMWWREHPPPHFHARYGEYKASVSIDTLTVVDGSLPPRILRLVRTWAFMHRAELMDNWHRARARVPLRPIDPLS